MITWESPDDNSVLIELWIHRSPMNIKSHENINANDISHEEWLIVFEG